MKLTKQSKLINERPISRRSLAMRLKQFTILSIALAATSLPVSTWSGNLILSNSPLFQQNSVQPNIFLMLDDSGSMDWEVLVSSDAISMDEDAAGDYKETYNNSGDLDFLSGSEEANLELCRGYNVLAYNPNITYTPWKGYDDAGVVYGPAYVSESTPNFTVRMNPYLSGGATTNLSNPAEIDFAYFPWNDVGIIGTFEFTDTGAGATTGKWDAGEPTECGALNTANGVTFASMSVTQQKNYANWYTYYRERDYVMKAALSEVIFTSQARVGLGTLHNRNNVGTPIQDIDNISVPINASADTNKRTLFDNIGQIQPGNGTPLRPKLQDVGKYYDGISNDGLFGATYNHTGTVSSISPILDAASGGECQQNFAILMTDGFWNSGAPDPLLGNVDGSEPAPYNDTYSDTLADVAMFYYNKDLSTILDDNVPTITGVDENSAQHMVTYTVAFGLKGEIRETFTGANPGDTGWPGWPDPITATTPASVREKRRIDDVWHAAFNGRGLYLSADNPQNLIESFNNAINDIGSRTGSASGVSVNSGTLSTSSRIYQTRFKSSDWSGHLLAYRILPPAPPVFPNIRIVPADDFSGGTTNNAILAMEAQDWNLGRTILSYNGNQGIPFRWPSTPGSPGANEMSASQVTDLVDGANYTTASQRVDFLRGDHSNEVVNGGSLRTRERDELGCTPAPLSPCPKVPFMLGDIVHSSPLYVGATPFAYPDYLEATGTATNAHNDFRLLYFDRTPIIYFGANDGMLHGIDANTGEEKIAYVPARLYNKLPALTNKYYNHQYYVDASPEVGDVFYDGAWHTSLIGALRGGGQGIFALDVTDPTTFSEAAASSTVLWEFTDADDPDLGYTFGRPGIAKMQDDKWYAIFGNGYNNTEADGAVSTDGDAVLFLIDIETGAVTKIDTGVGMAESADGSTPNGLARPALVDYDGDYVIDYIYAGDLQGNMWKFDVTDAPGTWTNASKRSILFTATDPLNVPQPITSRPEIDFAPNGPKGLFVIFGTGQYIEPGDITSTQTQSMYGIWDEAGASGTATVNVTRGDLVTQTLTYFVGPTSGKELRLDTNNPITTWGNGGGPDEYMGWLIDLPESGEKVIASPAIQDDVVIFISITPTEAACEPGGTSWFMAFRKSNGGRTDPDVIDVNEDGVTNDQDRDGGTDVVSGVRKEAMILDEGISIHDNSFATGGSTVDEICASNSSSTVLTSDSEGNLGGTAVPRPQKAFRQGWRQIQ